MMTTGHCQIHETPILDVVTLHLDLDLQPGMSQVSREALR